MEFINPNAPAPLSRQLRRQPALTRLTRVTRRRPLKSSVRPAGINAEGFYQYPIETLFATDTEFNALVLTAA